MNKAMEKDRKQFVKKYMHGATIVEGEVHLIQNFLFPEVPESYLKVIDELVLSRERSRQENKSS